MRELDQNCKVKEGNTLKLENKILEEKNDRQRVVR